MAVALCLLGCSDSDSKLIERAQQAVAAKLKDPQSAQFGKAYVVVETEKSSRYTEVKYVCGDVNAKNSFGGYVGATRYSVLFGKPVGKDVTELLSLELESEPNDPIFTKVWWAADCTPAL